MLKLKPLNGTCTLFSFFSPFYSYTKDSTIFCLVSQRSQRLWQQSQLVRVTVLLADKSNDLCNINVSISTHRQLLESFLGMTRVMLNENLEQSISNSTANSNIGYFKKSYHI